MVAKEGMSFLPSYSTKQRAFKGTGQKIKKAHLWMLAATLALILGWNTILTVHSLRNPGGLHDLRQFANIFKQEENIEVNSIFNIIFFLLLNFILAIRTVREDNSKQV